MFIGLVCACLDAIKIEWPDAKEKSCVFKQLCKRQFQLVQISPCSLVLLYPQKKFCSYSEGKVSLPHLQVRNLLNFCRNSKKKKNVIQPTEEILAEDMALLLRIHNAQHQDNVQHFSCPDLKLTVFNFKAETYQKN